MGKFGFKKLKIENWFQPDNVSSMFVKLCHSTGEISPATADDWASLFLEPELLETVPLEVRKLFEVARGSLVYGYFFYPLYAFASEQLFRVAESAITQKCNFLGAPKSLRTFYNRLEYLRTNAIISEADCKEWQLIRRQRNEASHPEQQTIITPGQAAHTLRDIATKINSLFR